MCIYDIILTPSVVRLVVSDSVFCSHSNLVLQQSELINEDDDDEGNGEHYGDGEGGDDDSNDNDDELGFIII